MGLDDLEVVEELMRRGRLVSPLSGYWHPGEIAWLYSYGPERRAASTVWADEEGPAAWLFVDEASRTADSAVRPDLRGGPAEELVVARVEEQLGPGPISVHTWADDGTRREALRRLGYRLDRPIYQTFAIPSATPIDPPVVPDGFRLLDALTDEWVAERAECHHRAFDPSRMTPERYVAFRQAPGYDPALDVAVVSEDDRVVAYAMAWADPVSRTGQLEPVGTRPHFWRRGLGQVACREASRRLRRRGMGLVGVNTWAGHEGNIAFYRACGFEPVTTIDRWTRPGGA